MLLTAPVAHATDLSSPDSTPTASTHAMVIDDTEPPATDGSTEPTDEPEPTGDPEPSEEPEPEPEPELPEPEMPVVPVAPAVPDAPAPDFAESELEYDTDSVSTSSDFSDESEESAPTKLAVTGSESSGATVTALGLAALAAGLGALGIRRRFRRA